MKKFLEFFKNKSVGYYIACGVALFSLILGIVFFATYNSPAFPGIENTPTMGNRAPGLAVETIGIFLLAGFVVQVVALVLPQYRAIQIVAALMFGLAFMKDMIVIADFFAGIANNVMYNGGHLGLNMFYFISLIIILVASVVPAFIGFYKKEEDANADLPIKGVVGISKVAGGAVLLVAAILVSSIMAVSVTKNAPSQDATSTSQKNEEPKRKLIEDEAIKAICDAYDYSYNPHDVIMKEKASWDFSNPDLSSVPNGITRAGHDLVYYFEGAYAEGYQGDYSQTYGHLYLWDDGLFGGRISDRDVKGYWYNSSIKNGTGDVLDEEGNVIGTEDIADCLNMVSNVSRYESIITQASSGFYEYQAYLYCHMSWGGDRSIIMNGYHYYPDVAMFIKTGKELPEFKVGEETNISDWTPNRVLKDYSYSAVFVQTDVTWSASNGNVSISYVDGSKARGISSITAKFSAPGEQTIKVAWEGLEAEITVNVVE